MKSLPQVEQVVIQDLSSKNQKSQTRKSEAFFWFILERLAIFLIYKTTINKKFKGKNKDYKIAIYYIK